MADNKKSKKVLHTMASDTAEAVSRQQGRAIQMAFQQEKLRQQESMAYSLGRKKNLLLIFLGLALIVGGFGSIWYFTASRNQTPKIFQPSMGALFFTEASKEINITGLAKDKILNSLLNETWSAKLAKETAEYIYLTEQTPAGKALVDKNRFFSLLGFSLPAAALQNIQQYMIGVYNTGDTLQPFILLRADMFNVAYDGMRAWEYKMFDDLHMIFNIDTAEENQKLFETKFKDAIVENLNARILSGGSGQTVLMYVFLNEKNILIAKDQKTLAEINRRLQSLNISR
jgi:hypothetical protein